MKSTLLIQLELGMNGCTPELRDIRQDRHRRARWWFQKMRQVVNLTVAPRRTLPPRAEQTYFGLVQPTLATRPSRGSR